VAEHFVQTVSQLSGRPIVFITHQLPKGLNVDEAVILGKDNVAYKTPVYSENSEN
jgi:ATP-binding cassette, subfamily B, bacterial HlyB/CyaB